MKSMTDASAAASLRYPLGEYCARVLRQAVPAGLPLLLARFTGAGAGFASQVLLARLLPPEALGLFYSVTSAVAVIGLLVCQGYPGIAIRFLARYRERGTLRLTRAFLRQAQRDTLYWAAIAVIAMCGLAAGWPGLEPHVRFAIFAAALGIPATAALRLYGTLAAAELRYGLAFLPDTCFRSLVFLAALAAITIADVALQAGAVVFLITAIVTALASAQYQLLIRRFTLPSITGPKAPRKIAAVWRRQSRPLIVVAVFTALFADLAIVLVTPLLGAADVAALGLCLKLAVLMGFAIQLAHQIAAPGLATAHARGDTCTMRSAIRRATAGPLFLTTAATLLAAFYGDRVLNLFGPEFERAHLALTVLAGTQAIRAAFGPSTLLLTTIGAQTTNAALCLGSVAMLVVCNAALVPAFGIEGAAIAIAISTAFWGLSSAIALWRIGGLGTDVFALMGAAKT